MPLFLPSPICVLHIWQMSDGWATWAKPGVEKDASSPLWKLHNQEQRENSCSFLLLYSRVHAVVFGPQKYTQNLQILCTCEGWCDLSSSLTCQGPSGQKILHLFPAMGNAVKSLKHPFLQLSYMHWRPGSSHALSLRSSRGYCGLEQCQGQSPLGNVSGSPAQAASTWLPLRAGLANAGLGSLWGKIRLDKFLYPSDVTLSSPQWSELEWSGKFCVGAAWAVARVGELCLGCGRLCWGKLAE